LDSMKGAKRMADQKYNGWTNRATWNVALWIGNDEAIYRDAVETVRRYKQRGKPFTAGAAHTFCVRVFYDKTPDGIRIGAANFTEIAASMIEMAGE
jgi:hypothetical protein